MPLAPASVAPPVTPHVRPLQPEKLGAFNFTTDVRLTTIPAFLGFALNPLASFRGGNRVPPGTAANPSASRSPRSWPFCIPPDVRPA